MERYLLDLLSSTVPEANDDVESGQFLDGAGRFLRCHLITIQSLGVHEFFEGRKNFPCRCPTGAGVLTALRKGVRSIGSGQLADGVIAFVEKQDPVNLFGLGLAGYGKDGLLADVLGLVADATQPVKDDE